MREKPSINREVAEKKGRKEMMAKSQGLIVAIHNRYSEKDPCFYLDESDKDLFERDVLSALYGPGYIGWMNSTEDQSLRKYIYEVYKNWQVEQSYSNPNNYNHPDKEERLKK